MRINQDSEIQTKTFLFSYIFNNSKWSVEIVASTEEEAHQKLQALSNAHYDGELQKTIGVPCNN